MWRLADEPGLYRQALRCAAMAAVLATLSGGRAAPHTDLTSLMWTVMPALFVAFSRPGDLWRTAKGLLTGAAASAIGVAWLPWDLLGQATTGALVVWAMNRRGRSPAFAEEKAPRRLRWGAIALGAFGWPLALASMETLKQAAVLDAAPPPALLGLAGALTGLFMGLLKSPAHLEKVPHPFESELAHASAIKDETLSRLVDRVLATRTRALELVDASRLDERSRTKVRDGLDDVAATALQLTRHFGEAARRLDHTLGDEGRSRVDELRRRLEQAAEPGVRRDLEEALAALDEQRLQLGRLGQGKVRLVARLERELASMECTETSLALLASGHAALSGVKLENVSATLARQARFLEAEASALQDTLANDSSAWAPVRTGL